MLAQIAIRCCFSALISTFPPLLDKSSFNGQGQRFVQFLGRQTPLEFGCAGTHVMLVGSCLRVRRARIGLGSMIAWQRQSSSEICSRGV